MNEPRPGMPATANPQAPGMPPRFTPHPPPQRPGQAPLAAPGAGPARPSIIPPPMTPPTDKELEPISLIEEEPPTVTAHAPGHAPATGAPPPSKKIQAFGSEMAHKKHNWKRQTVKTGVGAIRVKSFHGKYSEQGLEYLDNAINEWLDSNPDIEVKFVTPTVMTFEGKIKEPAIVLNVWY